MDNTLNWKQKGNIYLWQYEPHDKNFPGWHLSGDKEGIISCLELIDALESDRLEQFRTIQLHKPNEAQYDIANCRGKAIPSTKLVVSYSPENVGAYNINSEQ